MCSYIGLFLWFSANICSFGVLSRILSTGTVVHAEQQHDFKWYARLKLEEIQNEQVRRTEQDMIQSLSLGRDSQTSNSDRNL